jgi:hypothetical protein
MRTSAFCSVSSLPTAGFFVSQIMSSSISPEVLKVLETAQVDGQLLRLDGQLDRKLYLQCDEAIQRLGGKWKSGRTKAHIFPDGVDPAQVLAGMLETGKLPPKNPLAFFATTEPVIERMFVILANLNRAFPFCRVLEPEAGEGAIAEALSRQILKLHNLMGTPVDSLTEPFAGKPGKESLTLVELDPQRCEVLRRKGFHPIEADFLLLNPADYEPFDAIIMNPPFTLEGDLDAYIKHIQHAYLFLRDEGVLISVAPPEIEFASRATLNSFRQFINRHGGFEELPDYSFKESGTNVKTILICLVKGLMPMRD